MPHLRCAAVAARVARCLLVLATWINCIIIAWPAAPALAQERLVRREILALYDSRFDALQYTHIHKLAEMPLNHLGYTLTYWDVEKGLPDIRSIERYRGVLTWFGRPVSKPEIYLAWAAEVVDRGLKLVVLGDIGAPVEPRYMDGINAVLGDIGLKHSGQFVEVPFAPHYVVKDADMLELERKLDPVLAGFALLTAETKDVVSHLTVASTKSMDARSSVLVATSPRGGYAADEFTFVYEASRDRVSWILNPFAFFARAFGSEHAPIPDVTTLSGLRIYFSHIDGDGWNNVSEIERYSKAGVTSSEVVLKELIEPFPDLPVTIGLIAGDVDPELGGDPNGRTIARKLYALPHVEVGSHTHSHPFSWEFFDRYSRDTEIKMIEGQQRAERRLYDRAIGAIMRLAQKEKPQQIHQRYIAGGADMPRSYMRRPFELDLEVEGSLRAAEQLAPTGKRALLYQWSGDAMPFEAAIRATREAGVRNINGGDSRLDMDYPSVAYVPPIGRQVGAERQIYAVNSNENTYTNDWTGPFYAFSKLDETTRNTDAPRRLKAYNLYYHMYSGEKPSALEAVRRHLQSARNGHYIPIPASYYAAIADSFYEVEIRQIAEQRWRVGRRGDLQTVRFDDADGLAVDTAASVGVIGESRHRKALYVALDTEIEEAIVALKPRLSAAAASTAGPADGTAPAAGLSDDAAPEPVTMTMRPMNAVMLVESRWRISDLLRKDCGFTASAEGFGTGKMTWAGVPAGRYVVSAKRGEKLIVQHDATADATGVLTVDINADAINPLVVELGCVSQP